MYLLPGSYYRNAGLPCHTIFNPVTRVPLRPAVNEIHHKTKNGKIDKTKARTYAQHRGAPFRGHDSPPAVGGVGYSPPSIICGRFTSVGWSPAVAGCLPVCHHRPFVVVRCRPNAVVAAVIGDRSRWHPSARVDGANNDAQNKKRPGFRVTNRQEIKAPSLVSHSLIK